MDNIWPEISKEEQNKFLESINLMKKKYPNVKVTMNLQQYINSYEFVYDNKVSVTINELLTKEDVNNLLGILDCFIETSNS